MRVPSRGAPRRASINGLLTAKYLDVLEALLWGFHNARSGLCFPSLATIAKAAACAPSTVAEAIKALEAVGILSWVNRIVRIRERCEDLFGNMGTRWRIIRTSLPLLLFAACNNIFYIKSGHVCAAVHANRDKWSALLSMESSSGTGPAAAFSRKCAARYGAGTIVAVVDGSSVAHRLAERRASGILFSTHAGCRK